MGEYGPVDRQSGAGDCEDPRRIFVITDTRCTYVHATDRQKDPYHKIPSIPPMGFVGTQAIRGARLSLHSYHYTYVGGSNVSTRVSHEYSPSSSWLELSFADADGQYQDLIMWNQLTDQARAALESADFGEDTKVPFNDKNFETSLAEAFMF